MNLSDYLTAFNDRVRQSVERKIQQAAEMDAARERALADAEAVTATIAATEGRRRCL